MEPTPLDTSVSSDPSLKLIDKLTKRYKKRRTRSAPENAENTSKLLFTHDEQLRIVRSIAMYRNPLDIIKMCKDDFGKVMTKTNLGHYATRPQWQPVIEKFRDEYEAKIADEDLASKRRRVQELSKLFWKLQENDKTLAKSADMLALIREEIEGKASGGTSITQYNQYNGLTDEELRKVIDENTKFLEMAKKHSEISIEATPIQETNGA